MLRSERCAYRILPNPTLPEIYTLSLHDALPISNYDSASQLKMDFSYVYILQSQLSAEHYYVGVRDDLRDRLNRHNAGQLIHTSKFRPWRIKTAVAFTDRDRAAAFERYLKSSSGR